MHAFQCVYRLSGTHPHPITPQAYSLTSIVYIRIIKQARLVCEYVGHLPATIISIFARIADPSHAAVSAMNPHVTI